MLKYLEKKYYSCQHYLPIFYFKAVKKDFLDLFIIQTSKEKYCLFDKKISIEIMESFIQSKIPEMKKIRTYIYNFYSCEMSNYLNK